MKNLLFALAFSLLSQCLAAQHNVIIIIADDLGTDYCGFYENAADTANMPHVRSLLERGVRFQNAWASPTCSPTRAGMLTGRYSFRTGVGTAISGPGYAQIDTAETTLPKLLRDASPTVFATANIGKWHLNQQTPQALVFPNYMGYDHYAGNFLGELADYFNWNKITNGLTSTSTNYATTETVSDAIDWLDGLGSQQPFFLWLAFNAPHTPFHKPPDALHTVPGLTGTQMHINQNPKLYFRAMIEAMDTEIGRLFGWLQQNGQWENTDIVFIGDNGNLKKVSQITDTTQSKGTLYEYGVRVPFIIAGPSVVQPGRVSSALVSTPDLFATSLEMAGFSDWKDQISTDKPVDAQSLLPILKNESSALREWIFTEQFSPTPSPKDGKAIRNPDYKLLHFDDGHQEFYQLANDPLEQSDLLLSPPLGTVATASYTYLCQELSNLIGTNTCDAALNATELLAAEFSILPNPVKAGEPLRLASNTPGTYLFQLFDLKGQQLLSQQWEGTASLVLPGLPSGMYFYSMERKGSIVWGKVIVGR